MPFPEMPSSRTTHDLTVRVEQLVCPLCHAPVELADGRLRCRAVTCGAAYSISPEGIPIMLPHRAAPEDGMTGYYPKVKGGTMEDNPDPGFNAYDARIRVRYLNRYLDEDPPVDGPVLDLCCSKAPFYPYLEKRGLGGNVYGVDLLMHQLVEACSRGVRGVQANALQVPFSDSFFSRVIFTDALVHLLKTRDQEGVFVEIARVLKKGGFLYLTATNLTWAALMALLTGRDVLKNDMCTYFSRKEIEGLAGGRMTIVRHEAFGFYPFLPAFMRKRPGQMYLADRLLNHWPTQRFGMVNFFKLQRV
jgi:SAM-dependent methyltransferase